MPSLGLFRKREIWVPTRLGTVAGLLGLAILFGGCVLGVVPFLGPTQPERGKVLVVEGWLPDYALVEARKVFAQEGYEILLTTGVPVEEGFYVCQYTNYAQLAMATLSALGVPPGKLIAVTCPAVPRNRTYATARQVRGWLEREGQGGPIDVFTLGVHARRTRLLYHLALGEKYRSGIIAAPDTRYNYKRWWTTSSGFRTVTSELLAYLYARLFFFPNSYEAQDPAAHPSG